MPIDASSSLAYAIFFYGHVATPFNSRKPPRIQKARRMRSTRSSFLPWMQMPLSAFLVSLALTTSSASAHSDRLRRGSSLSVDNPGDVIISLNGVFYAGFHSVGSNAYVFAVWFSNKSCNRDCIVWMANRDVLVNGKHSKISLNKEGNLLLIDADYRVVWSTAISKSSSSDPSVQLKLLDSGNLVLHQLGEILWQSFDHPTDTLLPNQKFTRDTILVSSRARGDVSSGYYRLYFDNDNVLRLIYEGPLVSRVYWPYPFLLPWDSGRSTYNDSRVAFFDSLGNFTSSDGWKFLASDYGEIIWRRLTMDRDGNLRLYSLLRNGEWSVSWQAIIGPCDVHGICGPNAVCQYDAGSGRSCSCAPGYTRSNASDWSEGCKPTFESFCDSRDVADASGFLYFPDRDFYGYEGGYYSNSSLSHCKRKCLELCTCKGIQYRSSERMCFLKASLMDGRFIIGTNDSAYLRLPRSMIPSYQTRLESATLDCSNSPKDVLLQRVYSKSHDNKLWVKILLIVAGAIAVLEVLGVLLVWYFIAATRQTRKGQDGRDGYQLASLGFRRYTYAELKKATWNFSQEIGRGAAGTVYKAMLPSGQVAAVKRLNDSSHQGDQDEFLAEISMIGKLNHMNLIEMWGYCADDKHRLLVFEYMEHGSLADNLSNRSLDWGKRFDIAVGTAKGLAYLHEECLEWVLHCDVKPQNILLDSNYRPKVADFGLSKLLSRRSGDMKDSGFSKIRGTKGYMAPEWFYDLSITSKVDVYSYGIVLLEMVTGRSPSVGVVADGSSRGGGGGGAVGNQRLASWVRRNMNKGDVSMAAWIEEIVDQSVEDEFDGKKVEVLVAVALRCVANDKEKRPSMSKVVEILECLGNEAEN